MTALTATSCIERRPVNLRRRPQESASSKRPRAARSTATRRWARSCSLTVADSGADSILSHALGNTDTGRLRSTLRAGRRQRRIAVRTGEPRVQRNRMLAAKVSAVQATLTHYFHAAPIKNQHCGSAIFGAIIWRTPLNFNCTGSPSGGRNGAQRFSQSNQRCNQALPLRRAMARASRA